MFVWKSSQSALSKRILTYQTDFSKSFVLEKIKRGRFLQSLVPKMSFSREFSSETAQKRSFLKKFSTVKAQKRSL